MTSLHLTDAHSFDSPESMLEYERHTLGSAILDVQALLVRNPTGKANEFYRTMENTLIALQYAAMASQNYSRMYAKLLARVEIMEQALAVERRKI